eukprot:CAMPEP_0185586774 /NCGR_PEP_ID=MMETSP0434-20130131/46056_1 /TAXON_ID=626734 ORGANISM="Favella taraikaensis, Strain Fe Narragansett Bay" /NCGR_SAMPLE_ID=MMETSP0434 /ASSEMBLY_ACC=CAM_ASM_000379 /LENGTH=170 /DNA_ID=CAMNT_0028208151 /DNA_START=256 /DNA_END=769 /DNA_ORIENTATION=-
MWKARVKELVIVQVANTTSVSPFRHLMSSFRRKLKNVIAQKATVNKQMTRDHKKSRFKCRLRQSRGKKLFLCWRLSETSPLDELVHAASERKNKNADHNVEELEEDHLQRHSQHLVAIGSHFVIEGQEEDPDEKDVHWDEKKGDSHGVHMQHHAVESGQEDPLAHDEHHE